MLGISYAQAAESLRFDAPLAYSSTEKIKSFTVNELSSPLEKFDLAGTDLNGDGLHEFIVRAKMCERAPLCDYFILGEAKNTMINLGKIEAAYILLGNDYAHGVRNLLVFDNQENDFDFQLYTWDPEQSLYREAQ